MRDFHEEGNKVDRAELVLEIPPQIVDLILVEEKEFPLVNDADVPQIFLEQRLPVLIRQLMAGIETSGLNFRAENKDLFTRLEKAEILLRVLVFILRGFQVLELAIPLADFSLQLAVALLHRGELPIEEDVLVVRERETEGHEADDAQTDDDGHLLRYGRDFAVGHRSSIYSFA